MLTLKSLLAKVTVFFRVNLDDDHMCPINCPLATHRSYKWTLAAEKRSLMEPAGQSKPMPGSVIQRCHTVLDHRLPHQCPANGVIAVLARIGRDLKASSRSMKYARDRLRRGNEKRRWKNKGKVNGKNVLCRWFGGTHPWTPLSWLSWQPWKSLKALQRK